MPRERLREFLESSHVRYSSIAHLPAYTAQEIAALTHIPGRELAKTVMVKVDGRLAMAVLPASYRLDLEMLREALDAAKVELAKEYEFEAMFPDCEAGAMPPFGNLYGMEEYVDASLAEDEQIAFNAGSHMELVIMAFRDFEAIVHPRLVRFAYKEH
jgi:Ala-tRNA(Pro) deacylase